RSRVPGGEFSKVHWRGFPGQVARDLEPGVLKYNGLQCRRAFDDRVEFRRVATLRDPELHANHRAVADTPVEFVEAGLGVLRVEINEAERTIGKVAQRSKNVVVVLPQFLRRRI